MTLRSVFANILIVLVNDNDVLLVLSFGEQRVVPLFGGLAGIIQSFLVLSQHG